MVTDTGYEVQEFTIDIPEEKLEDIYYRLRRTRFPHDFANENWEYGFPTDYLREVVDYWIPLMTCRSTSFTREAQGRTRYPWCSTTVGPGRSGIYAR